MGILADIELVEASVPVEATFAQAAEVIAAHSVSAIAVLERDGRVVGLFRSDDLLEGVCPPYLQQVRHTAFTTEDLGPLAEQARRVRNDPVRRHMVRPVTVEASSGALHIAELFLHSGSDALPVVSAGGFSGMLDGAAFLRAVLRRAG